MRPWSTLGEFYKRYIVEEGVDFDQWVHVAESKKRVQTPRLNVFKISGAVINSYWIQISTSECGDGYPSQSECGKNQWMRCQKIDLLSRGRIFPHVRGVTWESRRILSINKALRSFKKDGWTLTKYLSICMSLRQWSHRKTLSTTSSL